MIRTLQWRRIVALFVAAFVSACASIVTLSPADQKALHKGMSAEAAFQLFGKSNIVRSYGFTSDGRSFRASHFLVSYSAAPGVSVFCGKLCVPVVTQQATYDWVLVIDEVEQRLFTWGGLGEIAVSADPAARALAGDLKAAYVASLARQ